jgi:hypothetical protein
VKSFRSSSHVTQKQSPIEVDFYSGREELVVYCWKAFLLPCKSPSNCWDQAMKMLRRCVLPCCAILAGVTSVTVALEMAKSGLRSHAETRASYEKASHTSLHNVSHLEQTARTLVAEKYGKLPLRFEANRGQTDSRVKFLSRGAGYTLFLTNTEAVLKLQRQNSDEAQLKSIASLSSARDRDAAVLRMKLVAADPAVKILGGEPLQEKSNYFLGNDPRQWRHNVPNFSRVRYRDAYPGIDLVYYGNQQQLEYDFVVAPGADPGAIRLAISSDEGAGNGHKTPPLRIAANGDLLVPAGEGEVSFHRPVVYQRESSTPWHSIGGTSHPDAETEALQGRWVLRSATEVGFEIAHYDATKPLIIDPALTYATYVGGTNGNNVYSIAVDSSGNAYIAGSTLSTDFPTKTPIQASNAGNADAYIVKLNQAGTGLLYSTYLGGVGIDFAFSIGVDSAGNAYVVGTTGSPNFPVTAGAFQTACGGSCGKGTPDAFITKVNSTGSALVYSTFLGGTGDDRGYALILNSAGNAFVTGKTSSADFPVTNGAFQTTKQGTTNIFVAELNAAGSALVYSTYLGGSAVDQGNAIDLDPFGDAYVAGLSTSTNFPVTAGAFQSTLLGATNVIAAGINPTGSGLVFSTYLGGSGTDIAWAVRSDSSGNAYVAGQTTSPNFPTTSGAFQTTCRGTCAPDNGFVAKVNSTGTGLGYSTFLGSTGQTEIFAMALDTVGDAYVTGRTNGADFATTPGAFFVKNQGSFDGILTELNPTGSGLLYSTYLGGNASDNGLGVAVTPDHSVYLTGRTFSPNFPTTPGAFMTTCSTCSARGNDMVFVAKFVDGVQVWPGALNFGNATVGVTTSPLVATLTNSESSALSITGMAITGTNASDFTESTTCGPSLAAGASCSISVTFNPATTGARTGSLTVTDSAPNSPQAIALSGTGTTGSATLTPSTLTFGTQPIKSVSPSHPVKLASTGTTALIISKIEITSPYSQVNNCGTSVAPGTSCTINVTFLPTSTGTQKGTLTVTDNSPGSPQTVALSGVGTVISFAPSSVNFGKQLSGTSSAPQIITMTNVGSASVSITKMGLAGSQPSNFSQTNNCGATLAGGASCSITVTFTPLLKGVSNATVSVSDNGGGSPQLVRLTGTGT